MRRTAMALAAAACVFGAAGFAWAQSAPISAAAIPKHPAEASGLVPSTIMVGPDGSVAKMLPTVPVAAARKAAGVGFANILTYQGGPVMLPYIANYVIFWAPSALQNGGTTGYTPLYGTITILLNAWMPGHGLYNIHTQYYQVAGGTTTYLNNNGGLGAFFVDTGAYPASGCTTSAHPGGCVTDAQLRTRIAAVMTSQGWTGGMNKLFTIYTSSNEGVCFDAAGASCSNVQFCGYHSYFTVGGQNVIYSVIPFSEQATCQGSGTMPNNDVGDLAASTQSHEMSEASTDPLINAWYDTITGNENGDNCAYNYGANTWTNPSTGIAGNQFWNGWVFELQMEWDNHTNSCLRVGP